MKFDDIEVVINGVSKDVIISVFENFGMVYNYIEKNRGDNDSMELMASDIVEFERIVENKLPK